MPRPECGGGSNEWGRSTGRAHHTEHDTDDDRGHREDRRGKDDKDEEEDKGKRIDLSLAQVVGAGVATLTAATAASYLNVYGTVIGTAVMAVLSTSATPVIQHWITRSGEQAKGLAEKAKSPHAAPFTGRPEPAIEKDDFGATTAFPVPEDATRTMAMPSLGRDLPGQTLAHGFGNPADPARPYDPVPEDPTGPLPPVGPRDHSNTAASDASRDEGIRPKRGWRAVLIPAGVVFAVVMLVILAFELLTGRSLTAWTQGQDEPTTPSLLGGRSAPAHTGEEEDTDTSENDQVPEEGTDTTPEMGTEDPVEPGTTPGDQDTDTPTVPTDPVEPPAEEPEAEQPQDPVEPAPGDDGQGGDTPQDGAPQEGTQDGAQGESAPIG